jgi:hypothetical protein
MHLHNYDTARGRWLRTRTLDASNDDTGIVEFNDERSMKQLGMR